MLQYHICRSPVASLTWSGDEGLASAAGARAADVRRAGDARVTTQHVATDHSWSDRRIALQTLVIDWLAALR